jgi:linoleoyl-CoA desaturase
MGYDMTNFSTATKSDFYSVLRERVKLHFQESKISQYGGYGQTIKTITLLSLLLLPYGLILTGNFSLISMLGLAATMGVGIAGLGMAVMHDANHGSYSSYPLISKTVGFFIYALIIGGNPLNWKIQHNLLHHRYTNIYGKDDDLEPYGTMRFTPNAKYKPFYRFQHWYAIALYGLLTLMWVLHKEFFQLKRYRDMGLIKSDTSLKKNMAILVLSKCVYFGYLMVIPMYVLNITFLQWLVGFLVFHFVSGLIISVVFQLAHVRDKVNFPTLNHNGDIENQWAVHQVQTTANFAPNNRFLFWFVGGLNFQIEHHLFPNINNIHYKKIANIVKTTTAEFGLPYHSSGSLSAAIKAHFQHMKRLGRDVYATQPDPKV